MPLIMEQIPTPSGTRLDCLICVARKTLISLYGKLAPTRVYMSTYNEGTSQEDAYYITDTSHTHVNWGFSKPGYYEIDFEISTVYNCSETLYSDILASWIWVL